MRGTGIARKVVQSEEIRVFFNRPPKRDANNNWSAGGSLIPADAVVSCVGFSLWLKPGCKITGYLRYNQADEEFTRLSYTDSNGETKDFHISVREFPEIYEVKISRFEDFKTDN